MSKIDLNAALAPSASVGPLKIDLDGAFARAAAARKFLPPAPTEPAKTPKRRGTTAIGMMVTPALFDQLSRFCEAKAVSRSSAVRLAVYARMNKPNQSGPKLPRFVVPPERTKNVGWSMSKDRDGLDDICATLKVKVSKFMRGAIYTYTKEYISKDKTEAAIAAEDAWI